METKTTIETNLELLRLYVSNKEETLDVEELEEKDAVKLLKCSAELIDSLLMLVSDIKAHIGDDLQDIWIRLDKLEQK